MAAIDTFNRLQRSRWLIANEFCELFAKAGFALAQSLAGDKPSTTLDRSREAQKALINIGILLKSIEGIEDLKDLYQAAAKSYKQVMDNSDFDAVEACISALQTVGEFVPV